jgi:hypothetical protein
MHRTNLSSSPRLAYLSIVHVYREIGGIASVDVTFLETLDGAPGVECLITLMALSSR